MLYTTVMYTFRCKAEKYRKSKEEKKQKNNYNK